MRSTSGHSVCLRKSLKAVETTVRHFSPAFPRLFHGLSHHFLRPGHLSPRDGLIFSLFLPLCLIQKQLLSIQRNNDAWTMITARVLRGELNYAQDFIFFSDLPGRCRRRGQHLQLPCWCRIKK